MDLSKVTTPQKADTLIAFMDIQGFNEISRSLRDPLRLFELLNAWAKLIITDVERTGGRVVKFIGDSCMIIYPEETVDAGVRALIEVKAKAEAFLAEQGFRTRMKMTAHFGEIVIGLLGAGSCTALDIGGDSVNVAASLGRGEHRGMLVISPQAFRKLSAATRKSFHKYTPPIVYVAEQE